MLESIENYDVALSIIIPIAFAISSLVWTAYIFYRRSKSTSSRSTQPESANTNRCDVDLIQENPTTIHFDSLPIHQYQTILRKYDQLSDADRAHWKQKHDEVVKYLERERFTDEHTRETVEAEFKAGNAAPAIEFLETLREKKPASAAYQLGNIYYTEMKFNDAIEEYENALRLDSSNSMYLNGLGIVSNTLGEYDKAIEYFKLALASDLETYGENHPATKSIASNLEFAVKELEPSAI